MLFLPANDGRSVARRLRAVVAGALFGLASACNGGVAAQETPGPAFVPSDAWVAVPDAAALEAATAVFREGGNAADAAAGVYFSLAVTQPAAGLGGGGLCLYGRPETGLLMAVTFLPRRAFNESPVAVPGNVRGLVMLHVQFGALPWRSVMAPALAASADGLRGTLERIAGEGATALYGGDLANAISAAAASVGGSFSRSDLEDYRAGMAPAEIVETGAGRLALPPLAIGSGLLARAAINRLGTDEPMRADAVAGLAGAPDHAMPDGAGSTGFVLKSPLGDVAACSFTMNGAVAAEVPGTGIALAAAPGEGAGLAPAFVAPVLRLPAAGGDDWAAAVAPASPAGLADAINAVRANNAGAPNSARGVRCQGNGPAQKCALIVPSTDGPALTAGTPSEPATRTLPN